LLGEGAARVAAGAATDEAAIAGIVTAYADAGCDEVLFFPCSNDVGQIEQLAALVRELPGTDLAA
jgi:hypothetical protein